MEKISRPHSIVWRSYAKKTKFQIDFKMRKFQGVSSPYDQTTSPIDTKIETL